MAFVELSQLSKTYGQLTVVDRVSLDIEKGALVCLLGPSGCGKTTTLRLVAGFVDPTGGEIRVEAACSRPLRSSRRPSAATCP